jgi:beta-lactamase class A
MLYRVAWMCLGRRRFTLASDLWTPHDADIRFRRLRRDPERGVNALLRVAIVTGVLLGSGLLATGPSPEELPQTQPPSATPTVEPQPSATLPPPGSTPTSVSVPAPAPTIIPAPTLPLPATRVSVAPTEKPVALAAARVDVQARIETAMQAGLPSGSAEVIADGGTLIAGFRAAQQRTAASTIKLPLLIEVLRQREMGKLHLSRTMTIRAQDVVGGTGNLQHQVGRTLSLNEIVHQMVLTSDNVAANILLDLVGMDSVNATAHRNDFPNTFFRRHMLDTAAQAAGIENVTSTADLAGMLERVARGTMISTGVSQQALSLLDERGRVDKDWLGQQLPAGAELSHINGTLAGVRDDVGLISSPTGKSFVLAVCQDHLANEKSGEAAIATLARRVYDILDAG